MRGHRDGGHTGVKRKGLINLSITSSLFIHPRFDFFFFFLCGNSVQLRGLGFLKKPREASEKEGIERLFLPKKYIYTVQKCCSVLCCINCDSHPAPLQFGCVCRTGVYSSPALCPTWRQGAGTCPEHLQPLRGAAASYRTYPGPADIR